MILWVLIAGLLGAAQGKKVMISIKPYAILGDYYVSNRTGKLSQFENKDAVSIVDSDLVAFAMEKLSPQKGRKEEGEAHYTLSNKRGGRLTYNSENEVYVESAKQVAKQAAKKAEKSRGAGWRIERIPNATACRIRGDNEMCVSISHFKSPSGFALLSGAARQTVDAKLALEECDARSEDQWFSIEEVGKAEDLLEKGQIDKAGAAEKGRGGGALEGIAKAAPATPKSLEREIIDLERRVLRLEKIAVGMLSPLDSPG